jgi:hypothetical protein
MQIYVYVRIDRRKEKNKKKSNEDFNIDIACQ